jgi:histidinol-phosphate/aromatic aminotransferase/cobyric acid decarboxylase-like protein
LLGSVGGHAGCMRVTVGTAEMNDRFLACVKGAAA